MRLMFRHSRLDLEANNLALIDHIASFKKPIIMSTGMQTIDVISKSVEVITKYHQDICLLECTNLYPSPPKNVSLKGIQDLKTFSNIPIGFQIILLVHQWQLLLLV